MMKFLGLIFCLIMICGCNANFAEEKNHESDDQMDNSRLVDETESYIGDVKIVAIDSRMSPEADVGARYGFVKVEDERESALRLSDFANIEVGVTTYEQIVDKLGDPSGSQGSGIVWFFYRLEDGSRVMLYFGETLESMKIVDVNGREFELKYN